MTSAAIPTIDSGNPNKQISIISDYNWTNTRLIVCVPVRLYCCVRALHGWEQVIHVGEVGLAGWKQTSMCATVAKMLKSRKLLMWHYQTNRGQEIKFGWLYECIPLLRPCWVIDYSQHMSFYIIYSMYTSPTHSVFPHCKYGSHSVTSEICLGEMLFTLDMVEKRLIEDLQIRQHTVLWSMMIQVFHMAT